MALESAMRAIMPEILRRPLLASAAVLLAMASIAGPRASAGPESAPPPLSTTQLDDLVAPVALYPDVVLDSLLPATSAPADVAAAAAFVSGQGGAVAAAPEGATWDPSVVALLQFPDVLRWLGENPSWVERAGFAVTMQQGEVLAAIQRYRATARAAGVLASSSYATVTAGPQNQILIAPATPYIVYVPVYDPWLLRGPYAYSPAIPFFSSWFSFSFGSVGSWSHNRIFWGAGIYTYDDPWWYGSWRNSAADWGTTRPSPWRSTYRTDQPWTRSGWSTTGGARPGAHHAATSRDVYVAPPRNRTASRTTRDAGARASGTPRWTQPVAPAAPVTRWGRTGTSNPSPRAVAPPPVPRAVAPAPRIVTPPPAVPPRRAVNGWTRRGTDSLDGGTRSAPRAVPQPRVAPTPRVAPQPRVTPQPRVAPRAAPTPRTAKPEVRSFPPARPKTPPASGSRARTDAQRGRRSLGS